MADPQQLRQQSQEEVHSELSKHQKAIIDYAAAAASAANRAQTEELAVRTQHIVKTEIHQGFEKYSKMTLSRQVLMGLGALLAFGAGFLVKGALVNKKENETNHVND